MEAESWGGTNEINMSDHATRINAKLAADVRNATGLGNFKATELEKALAGKQANVNINLCTSTLRHQVMTWKLIRILSP